VTVPVGLSPPETDALSAIDDPTVAEAGSCWVLINGVAFGIVQLISTSDAWEEDAVVIESPLDGPAPP
jgi:hypothetical protein